MTYLEIKALLQKHGQEHLLQFWDELSPEERDCLIEDIENLDLMEVTSYFTRAIKSNESKSLLDEKIQPIPDSSIESIKTVLPEQLQKYERLGLEEIAKGKAAIILMAGGQGTRLGVDYPKGMYNVGLPSNKTLFELQALRIKRLQHMSRELFGDCAGIALYIMTSDATHETTLAYFKENDYFGLNENQVKAFKQSTLPCFSFDGKIILDDKHKIARAPDGNGGLYVALEKEGILSDMENHGINSVHVFSVDNILVKVADPVFIGYCLSRSADCAAKVVSKRSADEPVGVVCLVDGLFGIVEYSEISKTTSQLCNDKGTLVYNAGNICNHYFTIEFLNKIAKNYSKELDLHVAKKKIPFIDASGTKCKPSTPNGIKIEKFVFDVFKYSSKFAAWEVLREDEFSGLKNSDSAKEDCPTTARNHILDLHRRWLLKSGAKNVDGNVEISPLLSYAGENLVDIAKDKSFRGPLVLN
ncbi:hypothetical protein TKK_0012800 [Trichogramma kaykai]|uniref:UDP-N-acetylglucosamine diphosphorylase n=1 Tax=Trichogramma kaykai TaxID=54128 RepID=A0ABD2WM73_9HYME